MAFDVPEKTKSMVEAQKTQQLFRDEVLNSKKNYRAGPINLAKPWAGWIVACIAILIFLAIIAFIIFFSITKKARVVGITVPTKGIITILAPNSGVVIRNFVVEGQYVVAGQKLFELSTEHQVEDGEVTALISQQQAIRRQALESERRLRIAQTEEKRNALNERLKNLASESAQLEEESSLVNHRRLLAQKTMDNYETLHKNGFVSPAQVQQKQEELIDLDARLSTLERAKRQLNSSLISTKADISGLSTGLSSELEQLVLAKANLKQEIIENKNRKTTIIVAPDAGTFTTLNHSQGQYVGSGGVLGTLVRGEGTSNNVQLLEVQLFTTSRMIGFVTPGQQVLLRYHSFPYQKFGLQKGVIADISKTPFTPNELPTSLAGSVLSNIQQKNPGANINEALYRIKVNIEKQSINAYGRELPLKVGMTLDADIEQESRKIWEWIFDPLFVVARE